jgi:hypothetical protein
MALDAAGAVAFSRTGDPGTGEFEDAKVIASYGEVGDLASRRQLPRATRIKAASTSPYSGLLRVAFLVVMIIIIIK